MTVSVVIPTWNRADLLHDCLAAIAADRPDEVIVVDNGSDDGTGAMIDTHHPHVVYLRNDTNEGFAPASNRGAKEASGDVVIFLNNDTLPKPGWWQALADATTDDRICGGLLTYADGSVQHSGIFLRRRGPTLEAFNRLAIADSGEVPAVTGACLAVTHDRWDELGGFDEGFRNGYEDVDLCLRHRAAGGAVWLAAECRVVHLESRSPGRFVHAAANVALLNERWGDLGCI